METTRNDRKFYTFYGGNEGSLPLVECYFYYLIFLSLTRANNSGRGGGDLVNKVIKTSYIHAKIKHVYENET
jgi:hypothetical protein